MAQKAGFLTKEGGSIKTWKKRWCVLKNGELAYSKSKTSASLGVIGLVNAGKIVSTDLRKSKKFCFIVETPKRTYFICAPNQAEKDSWITELIQERDRVQGKNTPKEPQTMNTTTSSTNSTAVAAKPAKDIGLDDFEMKRVIGKGSFGKVILVEKKDTKKIFAMKVLDKKTIIERNEVEHTKTEKNILQKLCHPFLVNLNYSFQTADKLYFVMDYVNGGELFFHLQKSKKFTEDQVRFYCAEIALGLEYLHSQGVLYRDLKPENVLLTGDGHICMTDFGISKEGLHSDDDRTATFCGTPEYLAPEVLTGTGYGKPVDWWSFGTLMFEMLTGLPPFYAQDVQQMYNKIMGAQLVIPKNVGDSARNLIEKLLVRDPERRLTEPKEIKAHPFFKSINWEKLFLKEVKPPFIPNVKGEGDTSQIDPAFTSEELTDSLSKDTVIKDDQDFEGFFYVAPSVQ